MFFVLVIIGLTSYFIGCAGKTAESALRLTVCIFVSIGIMVLICEMKVKKEKK